MARPAALWLPLLLALASCSSGETLRYGPVSVDLVAAGPLFEGPNTAQATADPGIAAFLKEHGADPADLRKATLVAARFSCPDSAGLADVSGLSLQVMSDAANSQELGVLNPMPAGAPLVDLVMAGDQAHLAEHLRQAQVTWVADLQLKADDAGDRHLRAELTFDLTLER